MWPSGQGGTRRTGAGVFAPQRRRGFRADAARGRFFRATGAGRGTTPALPAEIPLKSFPSIGGSELLTVNLTKQGSFR